MINLDPGRRPIIIGVGQTVHRPDHESDVVEAADLILKAVHQAERDAGLPQLAKKIDTMYLVNCFSWASEQPVSDLERFIGARPVDTAYTWVGATAPQWFVNQMAERLATGKSSIGLICGGEALYSKKLKARAKGLRDSGQFPKIPKKRSWMTGDLRDPLTGLEIQYGLMLPIHIYPLFENALRHREGLSMTGHLTELGHYCAGMSAIAAQNPYAWFKTPRSAEDILDLTPPNRMISWPYTRSMCSIIEVDQAAALFLTNVETAERLGIPEDRWIFINGAGDASDIWHVSERIDFHSSPSARVAADSALNAAGIGMDDIDYFDLYSCFPSASRTTRGMLGLDKSDPRPLTITGGMPYFGGPGNNYSMHAICRMVETLRREPEKQGLVHALSWFISKHSVGVYSGRPSKTPERPVTGHHHQDKAREWHGPPLLIEYSGHGTVETYSLFHDREGRPVDGVIVARADDGSRFLAKAGTNPDVLGGLTREEIIGRHVGFRFQDGFNHCLF